MNKTTTYILLLLLLVLPSSLTGAQITESENIMFHKIPNKLSSQSITSIFSDSHGYIWIGTTYGLNRYDSYSYQNYFNSNVGLPDNDIRDIFEDPDGNVWINTRLGYSIFDYSLGTFKNDVKKRLKKFNIDSPSRMLVGSDNNRKYLYCYNTTQLFIYNHENETSKKFPLQPRPITSIFVSDNRVYTTYLDGSLFYTEISSGETRRVPIPDKWVGELKNRTIKVYVDNEGGLWLYTYQNTLLLYKKSHNSQWEEIDLCVDTRSFNRIKSIEQDKEGYIWIISSHNGVYRYHIGTKKIENMQNHYLQNHSINSNNLSALHIDKDGIVWIGNFKKGVNYYVPNSQVILNYQYERYNDITAFAETDRYLYQGTDGGGLIELDKRDGTRKKLNFPANIIVTMKKDSQGVLWMGCYQNGLVSFDNGKIKHYNTKNSAMKDDDIYGIVESDKGEIWMASLNGHIMILDKKSGKISSIDFDEATNFLDLVAGDKGVLYAASSKGILKINTNTRKYKWIDDKIFAPYSLNGSEIQTLLYDSRGWLWVGHANGVTAIAKQPKKVLFFNQKNGLPINKVKSIIEDDNNQIWIGTCNGITRINLSQNTPKLVSYGIDDGLLYADVNERAMFKSIIGNILIGTPNGYMELVPQEILKDEYNERVVLTHIVEQHTHESSPTNRTIPEGTEKLTIGSDIKYYSLNFSTLDFKEKGKIIYSYCIDSDKNNWTDMMDNKLDISLLPPGTYNLKVKARNVDGIWSKKSLEMTISILPPWWRTKIAYSIYLIAVIAFITFIFIQYKRAQKRKVLLKNIELENKQSQKINEMKLQFYANISHELRTPLSLIIGPLEEFVNENPQYGTGILQIARNNAGYLLEQINQLLDFRKLDAAAESLQLKNDNIIILLDSIFHSFDILAKKHNIRYTIQLPQNPIFIDFDYEKLKKIINNLLNNAFKFTPDKGEIRMTVDIKDNQLNICIADTGCGIDNESKDKIFQRFYQSKNSVEGNTGNGIGLHIVSRYVHMHNGSISVHDNTPCGSIFQVLLPINQLQQDKREDETIPEKEYNNTDNAPYSILLVDDNPDFISFLSDTLSSKYRILTAENGVNALKIVEEDDIDLIVSDVMMPVMDGLQLCSTLKNDIRYSHIPIILLTAKVNDEHQQEGLAIGADDYITKPFSVEILKLRIEKQITRNKEQHSLFDKQMEIEPSKITITPLDQQFISNAIAIVENNIENPNFSVDELSIHLNISRGYLYKKMVKIIGKKPIEFIRIIRLKRSRQLLAESQMQISEIAYMLGYNSPKLFAKHFKEEFKITPSDYLRKVNKESNDDKYEI